MSYNIDLHVLELLASKICHDLISPIGAINNGIEFLTEMGGEAGDDVTNLISFSAAQASAKLQAFRMAYGAGGADSHIKPADVHKAIDQIIVPEGKIRQTWDPAAPLGGDDRPRGFCKILTAALLLAMECLPRGGELSVSATTTGFQITANGENAGWRGDSLKAMNLEIKPEQLEPKYVHAYVTGLLCRAYGYKAAGQNATPASWVLSVNMPQ